MSGGPLDCFVPDDLTIPQFFLDSHHPLRPARKTGIPWLIEDATGRLIDLEEVRGGSVPHTGISTRPVTYTNVWARKCAQSTVWNQSVDSVLQSCAAVG